MQANADKKGVIEQHLMNAIECSKIAGISEDELISILKKLMEVE